MPADTSPSTSSTTVHTQVAQDDHRSASEITQLLDAHGKGDPDAIELLLLLVYSDLKVIARRHRGRTRPGETLNTTALVHEAYVKISRRDSAWNDRKHFFAVASRAMKHVIVDYARTKATLKRGDKPTVVSLSSIQVGVQEQAETMLLLDAALESLCEVSPRLSSVFECRYCGGLGEEETAESLQLSLRTVQRDWMKAKAFLRRQLA